MPWPTLTAPEPVTPDTVRLRRPIGQIFVEFGFITAAQLDAALEVQRATGARIGEILVEQGSLDRLDLASALAEHWEPRNQEQEPGAAEPPLLRGVAPAPSGERTSGAGGDTALAELELRLRAAEDLLASRLEQPARVPLSAEKERVDGLVRRLAALDGVEGTIDELRRSIEALAEVRLDGLAGIEERVSELAGFAAEFRVELDVLAGRPVVDDPGERLLELSVELDRTARDGRESVARLADELRAEAAARAAAAGVELHAEPDETTALRARVEELEVEASSGADRCRTGGGSLAQRGGVARSTDRRASRAAPRRRPGGTSCE